MHFLWGIFVCTNMVQTFLQKHRMLTLHSLFWGSYFLLFFYQISGTRGGDQPRAFSDVFINAVTHTLFLMSVAYSNYFFFLPRFLKNKNGLRYVLEFLGTTLLILIVYVVIKRWIADGYTHQAHFWYSSRFPISSFVTSVLTASFVALLRFFTEWKDLEEQRKELQNEKLSAELKFLRSQVNPHFLFNTLNNLYSLAYSKSPQTTEVISRLSQMMRYMVYDSNHDQVALEREVDYMQNYISLEKLRLNDQVPIRFDIEGDLGQKKIAPLLLIPFLENAFKHGVSNSNPDSWVKANLHVNAGHLTFEVANSISSQAGTAGSAQSGIGLENVRKRLELNYPDRHKLKISQDNKQFNAKLDIQLG